MKVIAELAGVIVNVGGNPVNVPINVSFTYDPEADPLTIQADFFHLHLDDHTVTWHFSRELLDAGINSLHTTGVGDVKFWFLGADSGRLIMSMENPDGYAEVSLNHITVLGFLHATFDEVLLGLENVTTALDDELERILGS